MRKMFFVMRQMLFNVLHEENVLHQENVFQGVTRSHSLTSLALKSALAGNNCLHFIYVYVCMCVYIYIYMYVCIYIYIYMYIYIYVYVRVILAQGPIFQESGALKGVSWNGPAETGHHMAHPLSQKLCGPLYMGGRRNYVTPVYMGQGLCVSFSCQDSPKFTQKSASFPSGFRRLFVLPVFAHPFRGHWSMKDTTDFKWNVWCILGGTTCLTLLV